MSRRAPVWAAPRTAAERRARARVGRLEIQLHMVEGKPTITRADDLVLVADEWLWAFDVPWLERTEDGLVTIRGNNRTLVYRLVDHRDDELGGSWVGIRRGGKADR